jgi:hypothetical protein
VLSNPQVLFQNALGYIAGQVELDQNGQEVRDENGNLVPLYKIKFDPATRPADGNRIIYGNTKYKDARPDQTKVIPKTKKGTYKGLSFIEWMLDQVAAGEISPSAIRRQLWNYGLLSDEEIQQWNRDAKTTEEEQNKTIMDGIALAWTTIYGTKTKRIPPGTATGSQLQPATAQPRIGQTEMFETEPGVALDTMEEKRKPRQTVVGERDQLEEPQDITDETLQLPSEAAQLVPISGEKKPDTSVPYAYNDSLRDQALGYSQHAPHKSSGKLQNFIWKWPEAEQALDWLLNKLNVKENVVLFDEESIGLLMQIYNIEANDPNNTKERTALYQQYHADLQAILDERPTGRTQTAYTTSKALAKDRVTHVYVSKDKYKTSKLKPTKAFVLGHELGHIVERVYLDRLSTLIGCRLSWQRRYWMRSAATLRSSPTGCLR